MNDQELAARARQVARTLAASSSDRDRLAAGLLRELADRLDGHADAQVTEASELRECAPIVSHVYQTTPLRWTEAKAEDVLPPGLPWMRRPEAIVVAWCKGCEHGTPSEPCGRCGGPACANCRRCPPCDGPVNTEASHG